MKLIKFVLVILLISLTFEWPTFTDNTDEGKDVDERKRLTFGINTATLEAPNGFKHITHKNCIRTEVNEESGLIVKCEVAYGGAKIPGKITGINYTKDKERKSNYLLRVAITTEEKEIIFSVSTLLTREDKLKLNELSSSLKGKGVNIITTNEPNGLTNVIYEKDSITFRYENVKVKNGIIKHPEIYEYAEKEPDCSNGKSDTYNNCYYVVPTNKITLISVKEKKNPKTHKYLDRIHFYLERFVDGEVKPKPLDILVYSLKFKVDILNQLIAENNNTLKT
jgi:hypothetical protein